VRACVCVCIICLHVCVWRVTDQFKKRTYHIWLYMSIMRSMFCITWSLFLSIQRRVKRCFRYSLIILCYIYIFSLHIFGISRDNDDNIKSFFICICYLYDDLVEVYSYVIDIIYSSLQKCCNSFISYWIGWSWCLLINILHIPDLGLLLNILIHI
jgi:hypothetical protein